MLGSLRRGLLKMSRRVSTSAKAAEREPSTALLSEVMRRKERAHHWVQGTERTAGGCPSFCLKISKPCLPPQEVPHIAALRRCIEGRLLARLGLALEDESMSVAAAADVHAALAELGDRLQKFKDGDAEEAATARYYADIIAHDKLKDFAKIMITDHAVPPAGMPIGAESEDDWFADPGKNGT